MRRRCRFERARKRAIVSSMPGSVSIITRSGPASSGAALWGVVSCVASSSDNGTSDSDDDISNRLLDAHTIKRY